MNKTELKTKIGSVLVENDEGLITAADVSGLLTDVLDCTEIGGSQAVISAISGTVTDLTVDALSAENSAEILINNDISLQSCSIYDVNSLNLSQFGDGIIDNVSEIRGAYIDTGITGSIDINTNLNVYGKIQGKYIYGTAINFLATGTGTKNLLSVRGEYDVTMSKQDIISIYKNSEYSGQLTIKTDNLMPFGSILCIGDSTHRANIYSHTVSFSNSSGSFSYFTPNSLTINNRISLEAYTGDGIIKNITNIAKIILSSGTGSNIITGFSDITMANSGKISGSNLQLDMGGGTIAGIKTISGATGKYIDLANGTISGFTIPTIIPNDITLQSITGVKTISGDNLIIDNLCSIRGNSDNEILLDATYVGCTSNFTVDGKLRVWEIVTPNEGVDNININDNVNFNKNVNLAMNSVIEFATGDGGGIINNVKEITNDRDIDIITTGSTIGLKAYSVNINCARFKRVNENIALADIKDINTIMSDDEIYGNIKIDFPNGVITGFTTINDITNLSLSTIDHGSINVGSGSINVGNGSINVTVGSINMTNGSLNMNNATINTNANINISGAGKLIIGTIAISDVELQILLENAGIPLS